MRTSVLHRKLGRDLWRIRAQGAAIAVVVGIGVMVLVMMSGLIATLSGTRDAYFADYRLASVFAPVVRAPQGVAERLARIDGVLAAQGRISGAARVDLPGAALPVAARVLSLAPPGQGAGARLNDLLLTAGAMPAPGHGDAVVLLDSFAAAHGLVAGDDITVTLNGARQRFRIAGLARAPEFIFATAPGEFMPDDARFAVIWMPHAAAAAAYDMAGAFNEALLLTSRARNRDAIIADVNRVLAPYGGPDAYGRDRQMAVQFVNDEISGLRRTAAFLPPVFMGIAAFLLNIVISRIVQAERREIGLMKAFGHRGAEIAAHYLEMVLIIALAGAVLGSVMGVVLGRALIPLYADIYKFPFLVYDIRLAPFATGLLASLGAAALGAALSLRAVMRLTPAEAMRPPAPPDFSRQGRGPMAALVRRLDQPGRMIWRQITRQPGRSLGAVAGIAAGLALNGAMLAIHASFDRALAITFTAADRSDVTVTLADALGPEALDDLAALPGVIAAEPMRHVPVVFRNGTIARNGALTGLARGAVLNRALDRDLRAVEMRAEGVVLSSTLAGLLQVGPGQPLRVEVTEGRRPALSLPVVAIADSQMGAPAYMDLTALGRALGDEGRISAVALRIDPALREALFARLAQMPMVAGVSVKSDALDAFRRIMDQGMGQMRFVFGAIAFALSFGVVYNAARIALAERAYELASLRVLGFTRAEVTFVLFGEIAVLVLAALPVGVVLAQGLVGLIARGFSNETYQISAALDPPGMAQAVLVVLAALAVSVALVRRSLDRVDMVGALKSRE